MTVSSGTYKRNYAIHLHDHVKLEQSLYDLFKEKDITPEKICKCIDLAIDDPKIYNPVTSVSWLLFRNVKDYTDQLDHLYTYLNDETITTPLNNIIKCYIAETWNGR